MTLDHTKVPPSTIMVLGIASATDEFAERETGHRDHYTRGCGCSGARHSLRPLIKRAGSSKQNSGEMRREIAKLRLQTRDV